MNHYCAPLVSLSSQPVLPPTVYLAVFSRIFWIQLWFRYSFCLERYCSTSHLCPLSGLVPSQFGLRTVPKCCWSVSTPSILEAKFTQTKLHLLVLHSNQSCVPSMQELIIHVTRTCVCVVIMPCVWDLMAVILAHVWMVMLEMVPIVTVRDILWLCGATYLLSFSMQIWMNVNWWSTTA